MSELKKLETTGYSSKLDEIAKNDTEVFLKVKLSGRRTFGEYEFEPKNGFAVHFGNHIDVLDLDKCDVYQLDQPQFNENQQMLSGSELIGVIYSQLLEDFGFGYIEKDLWMIAENLSEKIANDQPQLNENQQIVLEWLKEEKTNSSLTAFDCIYSFIYGNPEDLVTQIWSELNEKEEGQVLEAFGKWAQEQGEE